MRWRRTLFSANGWVWLSLVLACGMGGVGAWLLFDSREATLAQAERETKNLVNTLGLEISHTITVYDLSLQALATNLRIAGLDTLPPEIRQNALFDASANAHFLGVMTHTDESGDILETSDGQSRPGVNIGDRDYFLIHRDHANAGLYVSAPYRARLRGGDESIAFSRRVDNPDGRFAGIVVGSLRLAYFREIFSSLSLGKNGAVTLIRSDGTVIMRLPFDPAIIGKRISTDFIDRSPEAGQRLAISPIDGVMRLTTYRRVPDLPMYVTIGLANDEILADWRSKAISLGLLLLLFFLLGSLGLTVLFGRELQGRIRAEKRSEAAALELSKLAVTDALTNLGNRRGFDEHLNDLIAVGDPFGLLLVDIDHYKSYNDLHGHHAGDVALQRVAAALQRGILHMGGAGYRYGGDEFAVLVSVSTQQALSDIGEHIIAEMRAANIAHEESSAGILTLSIGASLWSTDDSGDPDALIRAADKALYQAKRLGRNRVSLRPGAQAPA